jgi:CRISPR-associated protein Cas2
MKVLIVYDVATTTPAGSKRLRMIAQCCEDYGQRVQKSVFECSVGPTEWVRLRERLVEVVELREDSLRFYFLEADTRVEHYGAKEPTDMDGPLVI